MANKIKERSIVERLNDIEIAIKDNNHSDAYNVEAPTEDFVESSTVYCYEPDERKFDAHKSKQLKRIYLMFFFSLLLVIYHIVLSFTLSKILFFCYIADLLTVGIPLLYVVYGHKQKNKRLANSIWNFKNIEFYVFNHSLRNEKKKGILFVIFFILKVITLLFLIVTAIYCFWIGGEEHIILVLVIPCIFGPPFLGLYFPFLNYYDYYYFEYIFEGENSSYLLQADLKWKKLS